MNGFLVYEFTYPNSWVEICPVEHSKEIVAGSLWDQKGVNVAKAYGAERITLVREDGIRIVLKDRYNVGKVLPPCCPDKCIFHP